MKYPDFHRYIYIHTNEYAEAVFKERVKSIGWRTQFQARLYVCVCVLYLIELKTRKLESELSPQDGHGYGFNQNRSWIPLFWAIHKNTTSAIRFGIWSNGPLANVNFSRYDYKFCYRCRQCILLTNGRASWY